MAGRLCVHGSSSKGRSWEDEGSDIIDLVACGGVPQVAGIRAAVSLSEVMDGREESQCTFPNAFKSMENLVIKGGRPLVGKKTVL